MLKMSCDAGGRRGYNFADFSLNFEIFLLVVLKQQEGEYDFFCMFPNWIGVGVVKCPAADPILTS